MCQTVCVVYIDIILPNLSWLSAKHAGAMAYYCVFLPCHLEMILCGKGMIEYCPMSNLKQILLTFHMQIPFQILYTGQIVCWY